MHNSNPTSSSSSTRDELGQNGNGTPHLKLTKQEDGTSSYSQLPELHSNQNEITAFQEEKEDLEADDTYFKDEEIDEIIELHEQDIEDEEVMDMDEEEDDADLSQSIYEEHELQDLEESYTLPENYEDQAQLVFDAHKEPVYAISCHPTLPYVVSGGGDDESYVWNIQTGQLLHSQTKTHTDSVVCVSFNFDAQYYATGGMDRLVIIYEVTNGQQVATFEASDEILWLDWHPKGNVLVCGTNDGQLWLWNVITQALMQVFHGIHRSAVNCGQFTPNGKQIISGSEDGSLVLWDPHTAQPVFKFTHQNHRWFDKEESITALKVHPNHTMVVVGGSQGQVKLVHLQNGQILSSFNTHTMSIESIRFSSTLPFAAIASVDANVTILDLQHTSFRCHLSHPEAVTALEWVTIPSSSSSNTFLISTCVDGMVRAWDTRTGSLLKTWSGHLQPILCLSIHSAEGKIITGSDDGTCRVFSLSDIPN
ncbi:hypothetical protein HMI54_008612 [Coelomomyces lativittatus]|nr:hypothetical protein HMI55_006103 [Coelomomyces lativittatus]KAJ1514891.1 hypothetical protein HMI56_007155 [Coelomomyces lativittatus]KAJ1518755.1 hypothetical protein HMI54_008612 [Coelomomyces lativittatus]